ncbi:ABC transporter substrate-binding protein [Polluticoccus soli]|uniref:ABC transporter substrate-binding protein n=1 Tax=Polluticoccus soli TaxID=3034150 RepID=UPI0023E2591E|nr:ABC transporter substrate-binding protein [Flavipsychrobacter sp. JY13-12]
MKRTVYFLLLTLFVACYGNTAEAQIWQKIFKKEKPKKKAPVKKAPGKKTPVAKPFKKREIDYPVSVKKGRYRVDVLVPLYLDELVQNDKVTFKGKLPAKAMSGMEFYEGVKLAADTLTSLGFDIDVYVHDIQDANNTPAFLSKNKGLDSSDLIIGAVQSQQIPAFASFAKGGRINFISALSPSDADVTDNPYFTLLQPTLQTHSERIMTALKNKYPRSRPILLHRNSVTVDQSAYKYLTGVDSSMKKLLVNELPTRQQLKSLLDSNSTNVLIASVVDVVYAEKLLKQLVTLFPSYRFEVYGMPSWTTMASLKNAGNYPYMAIYITAPFYYDASTPAGQALANEYKKAFNVGKPGEMVYRGYETMYWYAYLLAKYGTIFNTEVDDNGGAPFTKFDVKAKWDKDNNLYYLENLHLYWFRYSDGSFTVTP